MAAGEPHRSVTRARRHIAAVVGLSLLALACGDDSGADDTAPLETGGANPSAGAGAASCREEDHAVAFSIFGAATTGADGEAARWVSDPQAQPAARPGLAEVAGAYRDAGYQILYLSLLPSETRVGDRPVVDAVTMWLGLHGFPVSGGVRVWAPSGAGAADPSVALIEELARMGAAGTEVDAAYAGDQETVFPLVAGGVASNRVYLVGGAEGTEAADSDVSSTPLPDQDLTAHATEVQARGPICP